MTADLSVPSTPRSDSTVDERIARLELELFEQSEKMTLVNRNLLRNQLALQDSVAQNSMLKAECERLSEQLLSGSSDEVLKMSASVCLSVSKSPSKFLEQTTKGWC